MLPKLLILFHSLSSDRDDLQREVFKFCCKAIVHLGEADLTMRNGQAFLKSMAEDTNLMGKMPELATEINTQIKRADVLGDKDKLILIQALPGLITLFGKMKKHQPTVKISESIF